MKKLIVLSLSLITLTACNNNSQANDPFDLSTETLENVQERISETYLPKSIIDDYEQENIIITNVCEAEHLQDHDNVDYIFMYKTDDNEYENEVALFSDGEVKRTGASYSVAEETCEEYNFQ